MNRTRDKRLNLRLTEQERDYLHEEAKELNLSVVEYILTATTKYYLDLHPEASEYRCDDDFEYGGTWDYPGSPYLSEEDDIY